MTFRNLGPMRRACAPAMRERYRAGEPLRSIAFDYGVGINTVWRWVRDDRKPHQTIVEQVRRDLEAIADRLERGAA